jgi:hypothetical protein
MTDNISEKRQATIRQIAERKNKAVSKPMFSKANVYLTASLLLFAITYTLPALFKVWLVLAGIGIIVGVVLLAIYINRRIKNNRM